MRTIDSIMPLYNKLTRGHCSGVNSVLRAEALLMQGQDKEAEILCYKALYEADSSEQHSICICAELLLAQAAILRGNADSYFTAVNNISRYARENSTQYVCRMADLALSCLSLLLGISDGVASWLCSQSSIIRTLYRPSIPCVQMLYISFLMVEGRYSELLGLSEIIFETADGFDCLLLRIYLYRHLAVIKYKDGNFREARELILRALDIALPDKIYLPFAQRGDRLGSLVDMVRESVSDKEGLSTIYALIRRFQTGTDIIRKAVVQSKSLLTPREREVANYAKERFSAKEIAVKLYISDSTVRTILRNVYSKLNIHSKSELEKTDF